MSANAFLCPGGRALSSGHASSLKALHLGHNGIGPAGTKALADALRSQTATAADVAAGSGLGLLDLSGNAIEGKASLKTEALVKARLSKTLNTVTGQLVGGLGSGGGRIAHLLEAGQKSLETAQPTGSGGSGHLARFYRTLPPLPPPGGGGRAPPPLRMVRVLGCGLERRHVRLLARAVEKANAGRVDAGGAAAFAVDTRMNLIGGRSRDGESEEGESEEERLESEDDSESDEEWESDGSGDDSEEEGSESESGDDGSIEEKSAPESDSESSEE